MIPFLQELNKEFKKVCPESYLEYNTATNVIYPYLTYTLNSENLENQEGFYIDVDIFDNCGANTLNLEQLTHDIKQHFKSNIILNNDLLLQFQYQTSRNIPTGSTTLRRRWIQLYCKVDWRN
ncbi:hypothetical protein M2651_05800 [Clostridium sp. SYSU_GA19001]|uniref:hypothetical protein n=1 Tax=Clostridium caldaquaticum TaxID=2940653 RepID=UPI0020772E89|nr:hypothetical protein [Clostridium caldaquaticum]MCM8710539.1 hypothetical protein [Clostridium caldaquaticum]